MRAVHSGLVQIRRRHQRYRRVAALKTTIARPTPPPVRTVRYGQDYAVVDGNGKTIGTIPSPVKAPRLGRNQETVFLWRED